MLGGCSVLSSLLLKLFSVRFTKYDPSGNHCLETYNFPKSLTLVEMNHCPCQMISYLDFVIWETNRNSQFSFKMTVYSVAKPKKALGQRQKTRNFVLTFLRHKFLLKLKVNIGSKFRLHFLKFVPHFLAHFFSATPTSLPLTGLSCSRLWPKGILGYPEITGAHL